VWPFVRGVKNLGGGNDKPAKGIYLSHTMTNSDRFSVSEPRDAGFLTSMLARGRKLLPARFGGDKPVVPVVRLSGVIGAVTPLRPGLTLGGVARLLERAFATKNAKAVALVINSPGGSPVQSRQIYLRIRQLAAEKKLPVLVFVEDVAASGGYMIACAGHEIFVDPSSILGSIGVVGGSFGFEGLIKKIGIERRLYTAGEHKATLDPFLPENLEDVERLKTIQREIHAIFIALVKDSRKDRLKGGDDYLFTGEYWAGGRSVELGLADSIGDLRSTLRSRYGENVQMPLIAPASGPFSGLFGRRSASSSVAAFGAELPEELISALEARAVWARYGF
jgi:signal peptide peptidase SppA